MYDAVVEYFGEYGNSPSVRDIQDRAGISSTSVVGYHLKALEYMGLIRRRPKQARNIEIVGTLVDHGMYSALVEAAKGVIDSDSGGGPAIERLITALVDLGEM